MEKPYVICHMLQSIDGRIAGAFFNEISTQNLSSVYREMSEQFESDGIIYGSVTIDELYTADNKIDLSDFSSQVIEHQDYIEKIKKNKWIIVIDPIGSINWTSKTLDNPRLKDKNIIEVLCDGVSSAYLAYLKSLGISYVFGGANKLDLKLVLHKLANRFNIKRLLLQGGGVVNGAFANDDLIDELSLIISPTLTIEPGIAISFETSPFTTNFKQVANYDLVNSKLLTSSGIWLNYVKVKE